MKPTERAEELQEFLQNNSEDFQELAEQFAGKPAEESLLTAVDDFKKYAEYAGILKQALEDRASILVHLRNVAETAFNTARLELSEGKNAEDVIEKARASIAKALPTKSTK